jgi:hypothetical protein
MIERVDQTKCQICPLKSVCKTRTMIVNFNRLANDLNSIHQTLDQCRVSDKYVTIKGKEKYGPWSLERLISLEYNAVTHKIWKAKGYEPDLISVLEGEITTCKGELATKDVQSSNKTVQSLRSATRRLILKSFFHPNFAIEGPRIVTEK